MNSIRSDQNYYRTEVTFDSQDGTGSILYSVLEITPSVPIGTSILIISKHNTLVVLYWLTLVVYSYGLLHRLIQVVYRLGY